MNNAAGELANGGKLLWLHDLAQVKLVEITRPGVDLQEQGKRKTWRISDMLCVLGLQWVALMDCTVMFSHFGGSAMEIH